MIRLIIDRLLILLNPIFLQRLVQGCTGLITLFLVTRYLSLDLQGWYYTFASIAGVWTLFDLGLSVVLLQFSAHFFYRLRWLLYGVIEGELSGKFHSLIKQSFTFYMGAALSYLVIVVTVGLVFFLQKENSLYDWILPWILLVIFSGLNMLPLPFISMVEGSGRIKEVYSLRIIQNILSSIALWSALISGYQLWAMVFVPMITFTVAILWLLFFKPILLTKILDNKIDTFPWRQEIWPMQWRVILSGFASYFLFQIYTPLLFYYESAKVAGQFGLSLTIVIMLSLLAQSLIARNVPNYAKAVAGKNWIKFDRMFKYDLIISTSLLLLGSIMVLTLSHYAHQITSHDQRILPIIPLAGLLFVFLVNHINLGMVSHLRAYKKEPLAFIFLISTFITIPIAMYSLTIFSVEGVVFSILFVQIFVTLPMTFFYWVKINKQLRIR